jgi:glycosyltransferase involved in cell wall biosynthesis
LFVPAYNEARVIRSVVEGLAAAFPNVVVVNDGSPDETEVVLRGSPAKVVTHHLNLGQGAALQTGITHALERGARYVVTFDADGQHRSRSGQRGARAEEGGCDASAVALLGAGSNVRRCARSS